MGFRWAVRARAGWAVVILPWIAAGCARGAAVTGPRVHYVAPGETLWGIGRQYGIAPEAIARQNHISDPKTLRSGQLLLVDAMPVLDEGPDRSAVAEVVPVSSLPRRRQASRPARRHYKRVSATLHRDSEPEVATRRWKRITVHHSGGASGNATVFDRQHRKKWPEGLFYHFVIGNGRGSPDGAIEVGHRWRAQIEAGRPEEIQICLVGDFTRGRPTPKQIESLLFLIRSLQSRFNIEPHDLRTHQEAARASTLCPGRFSLSSLKPMIFSERYAARSRASF